MGGRTELSRSDERKKPQGNLQQGERGYDSGGKGKLVSLAHFHCGAKGQDIAWQDGFAFKRYDEVLGNAKDATDDGHEGHDASMTLSQQIKGEQNRREQPDGKPE